MPTEGLFSEGLPADEDVVGGLAFEDGLELVLQGLGGTEAGGGTGLVGLGVVGLLALMFVFQFFFFPHATNGIGSAA